MLCIRCGKNNVDKFTKKCVCNSCYNGIYRKSHPLKMNYRYGGNSWRIFEKYNYLCALCSSVEKIEIHHKDKNNKNNDINNLIPLCSVCHKKQHLGPYKRSGLWSRKFDFCIICGKNDKRHVGRGYCVVCYSVLANKNNPRKEYKARWYQSSGKLLEKSRRSSK